MLTVVSEYWDHGHGTRPANTHVNPRDVACVGFIDCAKKTWEGRKRCKKQLGNLSLEPCG